MFYGKKHSNIVKNSFLHLIQLNTSMRDGVIAHCLDIIDKEASLNNMVEPTYVKYTNLHKKAPPLYVYVYMSIDIPLYIHLA